MNSDMELRSPEVKETLSSPAAFDDGVSSQQ